MVSTIDTKSPFCAVMERNSSCLFARLVRLCPHCCSFTAISQESKTDRSKFEDKFGINAIFYGKSLEGWKVIDKFVFKRHGKVSVKEGEMILEKGGAGTGIVWQNALDQL